MRYVARLFAWGGGAIFVTSLLICAGCYLIVWGRPGPRTTSAASLAVDTVLLTLFAAHHSLFAREPMKALFGRAVPEGQLRSWYVWLASALFIVVCLCAGFLVPWLGENFFPNSDSGHLILHLRAKTGMRIEETARLTDLVEDVIREEIPDAERASILDNIGLPYSTINHMYATSGVIGAADADILVSLKPGHRPTKDHVHRLRQRLPRDL